MINSFFSVTFLDIYIFSVWPSSRPFLLEPINFSVPNIKGNVVRNKKECSGCDILSHIFPLVVLKH